MWHNNDENIPSSDDGAVHVSFLLKITQVVLRNTKKQVSPKPWQFLRNRPLSFFACIFDGAPERDGKDQPFYLSRSPEPRSLN